MKFMRQISSVPTHSVEQAFWRGKSVFLTGHTGFKGSWLALWLAELGAKVTGYALAPPSGPALFDVGGVANVLAQHHEADILDEDQLTHAIQTAKPDVVLHLAAQSLVRPSYRSPVKTFGTNVMGTVHLLEAVRRCGGVAATLIVTSDKCYENREQIWGYREGDRKGGHDPYSGSKACAEIATASYAKSFFGSSERGGAVATARAGNVIGGGDWSEDRLVPDMVRGLAAGRRPVVRRPESTRPWQHVLEPLSGYLVAVQHMARPGFRSPDAWNFGPGADDQRDVLDVATRVCELWGGGNRPAVEQDPLADHEAGLLTLDSTKARHELGWVPRWDIEAALAATVAWYKAHANGEDMRQFTLSQILDYAKGDRTAAAREPEIALSCNTDRGPSLGRA